ncbi:helix-turn-helix domain-containing protein [Bradyrhizobium sp. 26S5]|uniref:helix-turn-helix domain-containing protein n=1 Tax=Bradyrhizobium sp. 26S5 TaxID=3139729 RepID=UPI0030CD48B9
MTDRNELKHFADKKYRDGYLQSRVRGYIAYQMQALREKFGLTQAAFAELTGKKQSTISRLENREYGKVSVQTLLDVACAADVALVVKFVPYSDFLDQTRLMTPEALQPDTIYETLSKLEPSGASQARGHASARGQAFAHALDLSEQQAPRAAAYAAVNDNLAVARNAGVIASRVPDYSYEQSRPRLVS